MATTTTASDDFREPSKPLAKIYVASSFTGSNPYAGLFYDALATHGVEHVGEFELTRAWLDRHFHEIDAIHVHWPEMMLRRAAPPSAFPEPKRRPTPFQLAFQKALALRPLRAPVNAWRFGRFLSAAKRRGLSILWTVHNLEPHEGGAWADRYAFRRLARAVDLVICHSDEARRACRDKYHPACEMVVMPIGNYNGVYPPPRPAREVRRELGMDPDLPLLCCLGRLREYKGLELACDAAALLGGAVQLLIAGSPHRGYDIEGLKRRAAGLKNVVVMDRYVSDQEFSDFTAASDGVLLPYLRIVGSSALLAGLTFERGVIASDLPYFREILGEDRPAAMRFRTGEAESLARTIQRFLQTPANEREADARALRDQFEWKNVVRPIVQALRSLRAPGIQ